MLLKLTKAELDDLARISAPGTIHETIAKHFLAVGMERAAVRCDEFATITTLVTRSGAACSCPATSARTLGFARSCDAVTRAEFAA